MSEPGGEGLHGLLWARKRRNLPLWIGDFPSVPSGAMGRRSLPVVPLDPEGRYGNSSTGPRSIGWSGFDFDNGSTIVFGD